MRTAAVILLLATCFFGSVDCYAQDPCPTRLVSSKPGEKPLTAAELVHRILLQTAPKERRNLYFGDVEFILRCGTERDATELFADVRNTSVLMAGATVVESDKHAIRVSWEDGFKPNLAAFLFNFDTPLTAIPSPGEKIFISGTYASYSKEPFQINMANPSFRPLPPKQ